MNVNNILKRCFIASVVLLVGCSTLTELRLTMSDKLFGREPPNPPAELKEFAASEEAKLDWSTQIGETLNYDFTPALEAGFIYIANAKGELAKLNAENGHQEWRIEAEETISGGVGTGGGLVLVGTNRGHVMAYDVNGKLVWKSQLSSEVLSAPRYSDGIVVARSGDNHIYGIDAADGSRKWVYERKVPALSLRSSAGIVVDGGAVYAGFSGGKLAALRADNGKLLWEATVAIPKGVTEIERIADITSLPVVSGPVVYAVAYQGRIAAVDRINGKVIWNREISSYSGINIHNEKIYVSHALGSVYSLDYSTGRTFWRQGDLLNRRLSTPLAFDSSVAVGDLEGYLHFLNIENGKFSARIKVDDAAVMSLVAGNSPSQVIVATRGGGLYAVSIKGSVKPNTSATSVKEVTDKEDVIDSDDVEETPRSILFKKDSILLPDTQQDSGPGISLPKIE